MNLLLNKGASLNVCDKKERQPLHWAAFLGERRIGMSRIWGSSGRDVGLQPLEVLTLHVLESMHSLLRAFGGPDA